MSKGDKKSVGKVIAIVIILIVIVLAVIILLKPFGSGSNSNSSSVTSSIENAVTSADTSPAVTEAPATEAPEPDYIEITVSGSTYLYNGSEKTADEIAKICSDAGKGKVLITDDSATQNAIDELSSALRSAGIEMLLPE